VCDFGTKFVDVALQAIELCRRALRAIDVGDGICGDAQQKALGAIVRDARE
jgi:hypothetical protein